MRLEQPSKGPYCRTIFVDMDRVTELTSWEVQIVEDGVKTFGIGRRSISPEKPDGYAHASGSDNLRTYEGLNELIEKLTLAIEYLIELRGKHQEPFNSHLTKTFPKFIV